MRKIVLIIIIIFLSTLLSMKVIKELFAMKITAKFTELEPIKKETPVYLKGFRLGEVEGIKLSRDTKYSLVKIKIYDKRYRIPANTKAKLKMTDDDKKYIELAIPSVESDKFLKSGSEIQGVVTKDIKSLIDTGFETGQLEGVLGDFRSTMTNTTQTTEKLNLAVDEITSILKENRSNIKKVTDSASKMAGNLDEATNGLKKLLTDKTIKQDINTTTKKLVKTISHIEASSGNFIDVSENLITTTANINEITNGIKDITTDSRIQNTLINIEKSSENIEQSTENIKCATCKAVETIQETTNTLGEAQKVTKQVTHLTKGTSKMLSQRFLFFKLLFGRPGEDLADTP
ncbi:MAG: MlaD family protein [Candidatus Gastranaerophilales bacterium]|nr:MlaD family protein [Candidatus Gastranaerophilales bacterium]